MIYFVKVFFSWAILSAAALAQTPQQELAKAIGHCLNQPPQQRPFLRYLTTYSVTPEIAETSQQVASYVLNHVSNSRAIVPASQAADTLLVFDVRNYAVGDDRLAEWSAAWERMAERDYSWGLTTEVVVGSKKTAHVAGGWINRGDYDRLTELTGSRQAILRFDQFVYLSSSTTVEGGEYYAFAGVKPKLLDNYAAVGVDLANANKLLAKSYANILISGVTGKPRRVVRLQGLMGGAYVTQDSEQVTADKDPFRYPDRPIDHDAGEFIKVGPNGMLQFSLYSRAGERQDVVPDRIAKDTSDPLSDGRLQPMVSCVRCHVENGLRPIPDDLSGLLASRVDWISSDPAAVQRVAQLYDPLRLARHVEFDRQTYQQAIERATGGMATEAAVGAFSAVYREYGYRPIGIAAMCRDLGIDQQKAGEVLQRSTDPVILSIISGGVVHRDAWQSSFAEAALLVAEEAP